MNGITAWMEKYLVPVAAKIGSQKHLFALRDCSRLPRQQRQHPRADRCRTSAIATTDTGPDPAPTGGRTRLRQYVRRAGHVICAPITIVIDAVALFGAGLARGTGPVLTVDADRDAGLADRGTALRERRRPPGHIV